MTLEDPATGLLRDCPLWRKTSLRVSAWSRILKTSPYLCRFIQFVIRDMPSVPFSKCEIIPAIHQTEKDRAHGLADIESSLNSGVYEEVSVDYAIQKMNDGLIISSSFTVWNGDEDAKESFALNFHKESQ